MGRRIDLLSSALNASHTMAWLCAKSLNTSVRFPCSPFTLPIITVLLSTQGVVVRLRISSLRMKLAASHFAGQFIGFQGRESLIFVNLAPPEAQSRPGRGTRALASGPRRCRPRPDQFVQHAGHAHPHVNITVEMRRHKRHARDAPFVEYCVACGHRIGMCG